MSRPLLSLCLIVRDEEAMLPDLLTALGDLPDEICAVDTGSTDGTVALLEAAGARVRRIAWTDDFAAARNAALDMARGDWILSLDADERPSPDLVTAIRAVTRDPGAGAATVRLVDELPGGARRTTRLLRLWRRDPSIRFRHRIHEDATAAVAAFLERTGLAVRHLPGTLRHLGYRRDVAAARAKKERDRRLLEAAVAEDPRDWYSWYKLLELARFWNDHELWREVTARVLAELRAAGPAALAGFRFAGDLVVLLGQGCCRTPAEELEFLEGWRDALLDSPEDRFRRGLLREITGDLAGARRDYTVGLRLPAPALEQLSTVRPLLGLARVAALEGDWREALSLADAALAENPLDPEALLAAVTAAHHAGDLDRWLADHTARHGRTPELLAALGEYHLAAGRWQAARAVLAEAVAAGAGPAAADRLARARLAAGDLDGARATAAAAMAEHPPAALGVLVCDLAAGHDLDLDVEIDAETADSALREWLDVLWRSRRTDLMTGFVERMGMVTDHFPWLADHLQEKTRELREQAPRR